MEIVRQVKPPVVGAAAQTTAAVRRRLALGVDKNLLIKTAAKTNFHHSKVLNAKKVLNPQKRLVAARRYGSNPYATFVKASYAGVSEAHACG
jgi:hypothetical protein